VTDHLVTSMDQLRAVVPYQEHIASKLGDTLDEHAREFIAECPFVVLSTADADGRVDASPKGDDPGFVLIEDDHTLVIPDRPGNHLAMGLTNMVANPHVGILFIIPGTTETLRVNGRAELTRDPELLDRLAARGKPAVLAIRVHAEEVFFHCAKAFIRSKLWKTESWPPKKKISFGAMLAPRIDPNADESLATVIDEMVAEDYRSNL
jgi:uncharacterized protein